MSTDTEFFSKRPMIKYIIDAVLRRIEVIITNAITATVAVLIAQHNAHNQLWKEAGPHLQDVVKHQQALEVKVDGHVVTNLNSQEKETK